MKKAAYVIKKEEDLAKSIEKEEWGSGWGGTGNIGNPLVSVEPYK